MRCVGIYSGTFDPVHAGHLAFANKAAAVAGLAQVVFVPEQHPRGKANVSAISRRVAALNATSHSVYQAGQPQFTIADTLPELTSQYPGQELVFLMGSDVAASLHNWPGVEQLVANHKIIIGMRTGGDAKAIEHTLNQLGANYTIVTTAHAHLSSSQLR